MHISVQSAACVCQPHISSYPRMPQQQQQQQPYDRTALVPTPPRGPLGPTLPYRISHIPVIIHSRLLGVLSCHSPAAHQTRSHIGYMYHDSHTCQRTRLVVLNGHNGFKPSSCARLIYGLSSTPLGSFQLGCLKQQVFSECKCEYTIPH